MLAKINAITAIFCALLFISSCAMRAVPLGGNVGALTNDEQEIIALDLFDVIKNSLDQSVVISMRPQTYGERVFIDALRASSYAVQLVDSKPDIVLDFYFFKNLIEYAGVATIGNKRRVIRRYAEENSTLVVLGTAVAWPGINHE